MLDLVEEGVRYDSNVQGFIMSSGGINRSEAHDQAMKG